MRNEHTFHNLWPGRHIRCEQKKQTVIFPLFRSARMLMFQPSAYLTPVRSCFALRMNAIRY